MNDAARRAGGAHRACAVLSCQSPITAHVMDGGQERFTRGERRLVLNGFAARMRGLDELERALELAHVRVGCPEHLGGHRQLDAGLIAQQLDGFVQRGHGLGVLPPQRLQLAVDAQELGAQDGVGRRLGRRSDPREQRQRLGEATLDVERARLRQMYVRQQRGIAECLGVAFGWLEPCAEPTRRDVERDLRQPQA